MANVSISIDVPNLDQAQAFYCSALGCTFLKNGSKGIRILDADNIQIYLLEKAVGSIPFQGSNHPRSYDRHWSPIHLDFGTSDIDASIKLVESNGGSVEGHDSGSWGSIAYCADPFGNGFCLIDE